MSAALINPFWFAAGATDPNFASVALLLHFDGANGSTTLVDSTGRHTVPSTNNYQQTTAQFKFGTASLDVGSGACTYADHADWSFDAGAFTVEVWARRTAAIPATGAVFVCQWNSTAVDLGWSFRLTTTQLTLAYSTTGADTVVVAGNYTPALNTWVHLAADRDAGNVLRLYADGVVVGSASAAATFFASGKPLQLANDAGAGRAFTGQLDDLRITKGVARYGGAFSPPTAPFPNA